MMKAMSIPFARNIVGSTISFSVTECQTIIAEIFKKLTILERT